MASADEKRNKKENRPRRRREADFAAAEINKLRRFAGSKCSYPGCGVETEAKSSDSDGVLNVGIACHIHGAQPNAARFKEDQPAEERSSALKNGIWLCMSCSKRIDTEWRDHPAELLFQWRRERERAQHDWVVRRVSLTDNRAREFGAATIALIICALAWGYLLGAGWLTFTFATIAAASYHFARYYRALRRELAHELEMLTIGSSAIATGGAVSWTWKRLLADVAPFLALVAAASLGTGRRTETVTPVADATDTVEIESPPTEPPQAPPSPPATTPEPMGAPGPPQELHVMSDDKEGDPFTLSPILDGVNQEIVGDPGRPKRIWVAQLQPTRDPGFPGMMVLTNLELHALPNGASTIGGMPDTSSGREMAPVLIQDSVIDRKIQLLANVHTRNVQLRDF